jgi:DNA repair ATPase RecN
MKIINLKSNNLKGIKAIDITPKDDMVIISGKNGAGKTSALDSIWYATEWKAGSKGTPMPIRKGEKFADVRLTLCEDLTKEQIEQGIKPKPLFIVYRSWTLTGNTYLKVTNAEGLAYDTPQKLLDGFIGYLSFDPRIFARMNDKEQRDLLIKITGFDVTAIEEKIVELREKRRLQGQKVKLLSGEREEILIEDLPEKEISIAEMNDKLQKALYENQQLERNIEGLEEAKTELRKYELEVERFKLIIKGRKDYIANHKKIDVDDMKSQLLKASVINDQIKARKRNEESDKKQKEAQNVYDEFTQGIESYTTELKEGLKKSWSKIPDQKLSLTETGIAYDGIPYSQISFSEQLIIALRIGMALNTILRVIRISDYSLLDEESKKTIRQMSKDENYQIWAETVDGTGEIGFYIENGEIVDKRK